MCSYFIYSSAFYVNNWPLQSSRPNVSHLSSAFCFIFEDRYLKGCKTTVSPYIIHISCYSFAVNPWSVKFLWTIWWNYMSGPLQVSNFTFTVPKTNFQYFARTVWLILMSCKFWLIFFGSNIDIIYMYSEFLFKGILYTGTSVFEVNLKPYSFLDLIMQCRAFPFTSV